MDTDAPDDQGRSMTMRAFGRIKADIMSGMLRPNQRLRLEEVRARYNIGLTPLREALTRLSALHLVVIEDQRGFRVAEATVEDMRDVNKARQELEVFLLGEAIEQGGSEWEEAIVAAFHVLKRRLVIRKKAEPTHWEEAHKSFHFALIAQPGSRLLQSFHQITWDQAQRYRLLTHLPGEAGLLMDEHERLMDAVLAREQDLARALLRRHIRVWMERAVWAAPESGA